MGCTCPNGMYLPDISETLDQKKRYVRGVVAATEYSGGSPLVRSCCAASVHHWHALFAVLSESRSKACMLKQWFGTLFPLPLGRGY